MSKLNDLQTGKKARVKRIDGDCERLMELGFTAGAVTEPLFCAPAFSKKRTAMRAYLVCGTVIALRAEDAERIVVEII